MIEIPGYTVLRLLGHGGMATVYLAQQKSLGREVALKVLTPALASDPVATERFLREARVSAKLHHPNIVAIFDVGVSEGVPYMAIAYEPGGTVAGYAQAKNDPKIALRIIRDIANALDFAHRQGVVHRDVKPENILLRNDGTCVLSDFGIAHAVEGSQTGLTREGTSVGTPHYMSPEQLRGEHVDARADIYSLGVVLYQLLTGELPYQGTDGWAIGMQHIGAPIPHLPAHLDYLQTFLDALLAKNPDNRLQSGAEVVHWIDARLSGQGPAMTVAMPTPMPNYSSTPPGARGAASIAILPFADLSQAKDQEYLADGLTEELCNLLAKVPGLFVASRSSAARF
jgi:serine/threonine protein kinase